MAAGKLNKYQMTRTFEYWGPDITSANHIGAIFAKAPQKAATHMIQLLAFNNGANTESILSQFGTKEFDTDDEYTWDVIGSSQRNIALVEARDEDGNVVTAAGSMVGAATQEFELVFAENWFANKEIIVGEKNELYQFRIKNDPRMEGTNWVYTVELMGGAYEGVPSDELLPGKKFSVETALVERDLSRKAGGIRFASNASMRNEFSNVRIYHKVSGSMYNQKIGMGLPVAVRDQSKKGYHVEVKSFWMHLVDFKLEQQFRDYKNNQLVYGRSNRNSNGEYTNFGDSGNVIKSGAGLYEQMEFANTMYYPATEFSIKMLEDALYELSAAKLDFGDRTFVIHTGERGAILFNKAVKDTMSGWYPAGFYQNTDAGALGSVKKVQSPLHENSMAFVGGQFTEFYAPNGLHVKLVVDREKDDPVRNKIKHPFGGPAMSYRFDIFDLGTSDQPNIFKCGVKNRPEVRGYQWGMINPFTGQLNNDNMSWEEDSAAMHKMATLGICVLDPTRTMSLIPNILR